MVRQPSPDEVEITLSNGKVLHFKKSLGDNIVLNKIDTYKKVKPPEPVLYYTLIITPGEIPKG